MSSPLNRLASCARQWSVAIDHVSETASSTLAFGQRRGTSVVLKISKRPGDEWLAGDVLRAFDGDGTVRVYESAAGAVLLERLDPGTELVELVRGGDDERATEILAQVMRRMAHHAPPSQCPTVLDWARGFDRYLNYESVSGNLATPVKSVPMRSSAASTSTKHPFSDKRKQIPLSLVREAIVFYQDLAASQRNAMLLHGDLHHYNVLFDSHRGWVAIDPKGVAGEPEYEVGAILRNPVDRPDYFTLPTVVERRLRMLTKIVDLDYQRALQWSYAQAVLSAIWDLEDGYPVDPTHAHLRLARTIRQMLG